MLVSLNIKGRPLRPSKASVAPLLQERTVLTRSPWEFVSLYLARANRNSLFYWTQARRFADAAARMPLESAPLLHYYSFMNAAKALLVAKNVTYHEHHGIRAHNIRGKSKKIELSNEGVRLQTNGVLPALAGYLGDSDRRTIYSLKDLLFNLPFVHRTYCLTYRSQADMFYPLTESGYEFDTTTKLAYFTAKLSRDFADAKHVSKLAPAFTSHPTQPPAKAIRSASSVSMPSRRVSTAAARTAIVGLQRIVRADLYYINGAQTLWYAKGQIGGPARIARSSLTLTLAAMHRLSELCRYKPIEFSSFLAGQRNWLISEFVRMAPEQYLDEIAAELTGYQFLAPNIRPAT